jgi:hypothetical protein
MSDLTEAFATEADVNAAFTFPSQEPTPNMVRAFNNTHPYYSIEVVIVLVMS